MNASKLIQQLERLIKEHGDLPVNVSVHDGEGNHEDSRVTAVVLCADKDEKVVSFLIADQELALAFL